VAYLASSLFLDHNSELIVLVVNTLQRDLADDNILVGAPCRGNRWRGCADAVSAVRLVASIACVQASAHRGLQTYARRLRPAAHESDGDAEETDMGGAEICHANLTPYRTQPPSLLRRPRATLTQPNPKIHTNC